MLTLIELYYGFLNHKEPKEWNDMNEIKYELPIFTIALSKKRTISSLNYLKVKLMTDNLLKTTDVKLVCKNINYRIISKE